jgi:hypothetical protein
MGSKKILKKTKFGPILAMKKGETAAQFVRRQQKAFEDFKKSKKIK